MANLTIKNNSYEPIALRQQQAKVGYEGAKIVDQSGVYAQAGEAFKKVNAMVIAKEESDEAERVLLASSEVTSRGLGDVYKRQILNLICKAAMLKMLKLYMNRKPKLSWMKFMQVAV